MVGEVFALARRDRRGSLAVVAVVAVVVEVIELSTDLNEWILSDAILCLIRDSAVPNMAARRRLSSPILFDREIDRERDS